ncbi:olfactory receptor 6M1-like [Bombina bombina]|uniref:olfactory receptor 6M1-like n=1 Tax=Bombina bombina TaxID=8345 RepID=UPI00235AAF65|nr:olfactory receptor 6M1-like [Bombina bombina]
MKNETFIAYFVIKGFSVGSSINIIIFVILLLTFFFTIFANFCIIVIICTDYNLQSPMYLFLVSLSFLEICAISVILPKFMTTLITKKTRISNAGCFTQSFFYFFLTTSDFFLLSVMSFDRYVAICYPLRYSTIMRKSTCIHLVAGCYILSFLCLLYPTIMMSNLPFCGYMLDHFYCESTAMLKLICVDTSLIKLSAIIISVFVLIGPLTITVISYICIVYTVIKIPSDRGRQKTFSTCLSHLTMVSIVFGSAIFIEIRPSREYSLETDKVVNLVSTVLGPLLNPFIYTLRNKNVKDSIKKRKWNNNWKF